MADKELHDEASKAQRFAEMREEALRFYEANSREASPYVEPKGYCYPDPNPPEIWPMPRGGSLVIDNNKPVTPEQTKAVSDLIDQVVREMRGSEA